MEKELEIEIMQGTVKNFISKKAENIQQKSKEMSITAMKFVKFESRANEDFQGQGFKLCSEIKKIRLLRKKLNFIAVIRQKIQ